MVDIDMVGSKMRTFGPKSGAAPEGLELPPHWGVVVQLGGQVAGGVDASPPASLGVVPEPSGVEVAAPSSSEPPPSGVSRPPESPTVSVPPPSSPLDDWPDPGTEQPQRTLANRT